LILLTAVVNQMSKMGFRGAGLGKDGTGRTEPLPIAIAKGRAGLGVQERKRREAQVALSAQQGRESSFLDAQRRAFEVSRLQRELAQALSACRELDAASGAPRSAWWAGGEEDARIAASHAAPNTEAMVTQQNPLSASAIRTKPALPLLHQTNTLPICLKPSQSTCSPPPLFMPILEHPPAWPPSLDRASTVVRQRRL
jgi:hypothetical protein